MGGCGLSGWVGVCVLHASSVYQAVGAVQHNVVCSLHPCATSWMHVELR